MKGMGIDPGLATFGWCLLEEDDNLELEPTKVGFYSTQKRKNLKASDDLMERANQLTDWIWTLLSDHEPDFVVCEAFSAPRHATSAAKLTAGYIVTLTACRMLQIPFLQIRRTVVLDHFKIERKAHGARKRREEIKTNVLALVAERWPSMPGMPKAKAKKEHPADALVTGLAAVAQSNFHLRFQFARDHNDVVLVE